MLAQTRIDGTSRTFHAKTAVALDLKMKIIMIILTRAPYTGIPPPPLPTPTLDPKGLWRSRAMGGCVLTSPHVVTLTRLTPSSRRGRLRGWEMQAAPSLSRTLQPSTYAALLSPSAQNSVRHCLPAPETVGARSETLLWTAKRFSTALPRTKKRGTNPTDPPRKHSPRRAMKTDYAVADKPKPFHVC